MRRVSSPLYSQIAVSLLGLLSREKPPWELPAMAFLVEVSLMASAASPSCLHLSALSQLQLPGTVPRPVLLPGPSPVRVQAPDGRAPRHCSVPFRSWTAWT